MTCFRMPCPYCAQPCVFGIVIPYWTVSLTVTTLTVCVPVFLIPKSSHHQYDCIWRWTLVVKLTLAFGIPQKGRFLSTKSKSFSIWRFLREGLGVSLKLALTVLLCLTEFALIVLTFLIRTDISYWMSVLKLALAVLTFPTELALTVQIFLTQYF
jgi:hypothetical protein